MSTLIKIFDPNDKPFGCLSNNYKQNRLESHDIKFSNGKTCTTLTNYIYANLLKDESNKKLLCSLPNYPPYYKNVKTTFENKGDTQR